ncbi:MAG: hypothetical protein K2X11_04170 [Acetobacteraceae bacterium]|nr:hypothetical protein [Acetobacteraceae bacterium]
MQNTLAGLVFLILGDSHFASQNFLITTLHDDLMRRGARVATFGACGAPASIFLEARIASCGTAERVGSGAVQVRRPPQGRTRSCPRPWCRT